MKPLTERTDRIFTELWNVVQKASNEGANNSMLPQFRSLIWELKEIASNGTRKSDAINESQDAIDSFKYWVGSNGQGGSHIDGLAVRKHLSSLQDIIRDGLPKSTDQKTELSNDVTF